jgi:hypothetical protein
MEPIHLRSINWDTPLKSALGTMGAGGCYFMYTITLEALPIVINIIFLYIFIAHEEERA